MVSHHDEQQEVREDNADLHGKCQERRRCIVRMDGNEFDNVHVDYLLQLLARYITTLLFEHYKNKRAARFLTLRNCQACFY